MKKSIFLKSVKIREKIRFFLLSWLRPQVLTIENERKLLNRELKSHWVDRRINVYELIHEQWETDNAKSDQNVDKRFIVFIDHELSIDWITKTDLDAKSTRLIAIAETVGARRSKHLPKEQVLELKRLVGQSITCAIQGDEKECQSLAKKASDFLKARTTERSRFWSLLNSHILFFAVSTLFLFKYTQCIEFLTFNENLGVAALGGFVGSYLSILLNAGNGEWDASAGFCIHTVEVFTKLILGIAFGVIALVISRSVHSPPSLNAISKDVYSIFVLGAACGFTERLVPKIITKYTEEITK